MSHPNSKISILFIDDDLYDSQLYVSKLYLNGFLVDYASNTDKALNFIKQKNYCIIVLDIMMPPGSTFDFIETAGGFKTGLLLAREIRNWQHDAVIIAFTNSTDPEIKAWFSNNESTLYFNKSEISRKEFDVKITEIAKNCSKTTLRKYVEPKIFISYSWDSAKHKNWVKKFADRLLVDGIDVIFDQYNLHIGDDKHQFMEDSVSEATHILIICTPLYVEKANSRKSGVGEETGLIVPKFYKHEFSGKIFIPIIRDKSSYPITPDYLSSLIYIDFSVDKNFDNEYQTLIRLLYEHNKDIQPKQD